MNMMRKNFLLNSGITLVALVITIIILLILAGISISSLTGNGLFKKAEDAKHKTERMEIIEKARMDIFEKQTDNLGNFTENELVEILKKYGDLSSTEKTILGETLTTKDKEYEIKVSEIYNKPFESNTVTFKIIVPEGKEKYGGTFEVEKGTTWEEFFYSNFEKNYDGWLYKTDSKAIILFLEDTGYRVLYTHLCDSNGNSVKKDAIIVAR